MEVQSLILVKLANEGDGAIAWEVVHLEGGCRQPQLDTSIVATAVVRLSGGPVKKRSLYTSGLRHVYAPFAEVIDG